MLPRREKASGTGIYHRALRGQVCDKRVEEVSPSNMRRYMCGSVAGRARHGARCAALLSAPSH